MGEVDVRGWKPELKMFEIGNVRTYRSGKNKVDVQPEYR